MQATCSHSDVGHTRSVMLYCEENPYDDIQNTDVCFGTDETDQKCEGINYETEFNKPNICNDNIIYGDGKLYVEDDLYAEIQPENIVSSATDKQLQYKSNAGIPIHGTESIGASSRKLGGSLNNSKYEETLDDLDYHVLFSEEKDYANSTQTAEEACHTIYEDNQKYNVNDDLDVIVLLPGQEIEVDSN